MRDVDDADTLVFQLRDQAEQALHRIVEQRTGGLIHDQNARVRGQRASDGDQLHFSGAETAEHRSRAVGQANPIEKRLREAVQFAKFHRPADGDIFGDAQVREQIELLIDNPDAEALRIERTLYLDLFSVEENLSGVGANRSGDDFRKGAFARAVFAHQRVDFAGGQGETGAAQGLHAVVVFADAFGAQSFSHLREDIIKDTMAGSYLAFLLLAVPCLADSSFQITVKPFIEKSCVSCHNGKLQSGGLNLKAAVDVQKDRDNWEQIVEKLKAGSMPPKGMPTQARDRTGGVRHQVAGRRVRARGCGHETRSRARDGAALEPLRIQQHRARSAGRGFPAG